MVECHNPATSCATKRVAETYRGERIKAEVERVQGAWARRLPETPRPFRYEEGKMLIHQDNGTWKANWGKMMHPQSGAGSRTRHSGGIMVVISPK